DNLAHYFFDCCNLVASGLVVTLCGRDVAKDLGASFFDRSLSYNFDESFSFLEREPLNRFQHVVELRGLPHERIIAADASADSLKYPNDPLQPVVGDDGFVDERLAGPAEDFRFVDGVLEMIFAEAQRPHVRDRD